MTKTSLASRTGMAADRRFPSLMILPTLIVLIVLTAYPLIFTFIYSFTDYHYLKGTSNFVGLKNYVSLFSNAYFRQAIFNTVKFTCFAVI